MASAYPVSEHSKEDLQKALEIIREMMGEMYQEASLGARLNEMNITTEWAEGVKEMFTSPVKSNFEALKSIENSIIDMIHRGFLDFLNSKNHLIDKAYRVTDNYLHYALILNSQDIENQAEIIEYKMEYDETPVSRRFPLILSFLEPGELEGADFKEELDIG